MASTANVLSSSLQAAPAATELRAVPAPEPRPDRWGWLRLVRESLGGALLLVAWLALWTVTWAAVAGPLAPAREAPPAAVDVRT